MKIADVYQRKVRLGAGPDFKEALPLGTGRTGAPQSVLLPPGPHPLRRGSNLKLL